MNTQISKFTHLLRVSETTYALFNSLWLRVIFLQEPYISFTREFLESGELPIETEETKQFLNLLKEERFLQPKEDDKLLQTLRNEMVEENVSIMYLILSQTCNLACGYCYLKDMIEDNPLTEEAYMSEEMIISAIDYFRDLVVGKVVHPQIVLYGGEPTLNKNLPLVLEYAMEQIPNVQLSMVTNATTITTTLARQLAKYNVNVGVSVDGPEYLHNAKRIFRGGEGSFNRTMEGYRILDDAGVRVGISCTITPNNAPTLLETMEWFLDDAEVNGIDFNLLVGEKDPDYPELAAQGLIKCYRLSQQRDIPLERVLRRVIPFSEGELYLHDCGGTGNQIVVSPGGMVGACQGFLNSGEFFFNMGDVPNPNKHPLWLSWRKRSPINIAECQACPAMGICGGGCFYGSYEEHGDIMQIDPIHCAHVLATLDVILKDLWEKQADGSEK